jgi:hypothetical protein
MRAARLAAPVVSPNSALARRNGRSGFRRLIDMASVNKVSRKTLARKMRARPAEAPTKAARAPQDARKAGRRAKPKATPAATSRRRTAAPKASAPTPRGEIAAQAASGRLPQPPDGSAWGSPRNREQLAECVALVQAGNIRKLESFNLSRGGMRAAIMRYRDLALIALKAQRAAAKPAK